MDLQDLNIQDIIRIILRRKFMILTFFVITATIASIVTFSMVPIYTASTKILVEEQNINPLNASRDLRFDRRFLSTQYQIIKSVNVAKNVVKILSLDTVHSHHFFARSGNNPGFLSSIKKSIKEFISGLTKIEELDVEEDLGQEPIDQLPAVDELTASDIIAGRLTGGLEVFPVRNTDIIELSYSDTNPVMAQMIVNAFVEAYIEEVLEINMSTASRTMKWMAKKAEEERINLEKSERALHQYMRDRNIVSSEDRRDTVYDRLTVLSTQLTEAVARRNDLDEKIKNISKFDLTKNISEIESYPTFSTDPSMVSLRQKISAIEQNIDELSKKYGEKHPLMIRARSEKKILEDGKRQNILRIIEIEKNNYELTRANVHSLRSRISETKREALFLSENFLQHSILKREVDSNRIIYRSLLEELKVQKLANQEQRISVWVIEKARVPSYPSKPNKKKYLMLGLMLALCGGIGIAFLIEFLDNTIKSSDDMEKRYGLTVLGTILQSKEKEKTAERIVQFDSMSVIAESYKAIRTSILLSSAEKPPKKILISSMSPKEGKTTISSNLAATIADNDFKVVLIDCDLRKSRLHKVFELNNHKGLSSYLAGSAGTGIIISEPTIANYSIIPAGPPPPNPAELLGSNRFKELISKLEAKYDFIILDSPPIMNVTDSLLLSKLVDGMIIVCRAGQTKYETFSKGMKVLGNVKSHILGCIVNGIEIKQAGYYYYGYESPYVAEEVD